MVPAGPIGLVMNPNFRNFALWVVIFLLVLALVTLFQSPSQRSNTNEIPYSQLINRSDPDAFPASWSRDRRSRVPSRMVATS